MNENEKRYQRSFRALHLSGDFSKRLEESLEDERKGKKMKTSTIRGLGRAAAAIAICTATLGVGGICYAADVGGIRSSVELWFRGEKNEVEVSEDGLGYSWTDEDGEEHGFGGMTFDENGNEIPMSAEELAVFMNNEAHLEAKDGRTILYYKSISADVTDMITENGELRVHIADPQNPYTYFHFDEIDGGSYGCSSSDHPEGGEYIELDAEGLSGEEGPLPERREGEEVGVYATVTED